MFNDLVTERNPPPNRVGTCFGDKEQYLTEGAVMVAFAMYLFQQYPQLRHVNIHPDGLHGKHFSFLDRLAQRDFHLLHPTGRTTYGGTYRSADGRSINIELMPGKGDVAAEAEQLDILAECKGGLLNTRHSGQISRLRRGLCEAIGMCLGTPFVPGRRQFAVVPHTEVTQRLAAKMAQRALAGSGNRDCPD
jgi:hypothetical protein